MDLELSEGEEAITGDLSSPDDSDAGESERHIGEDSDADQYAGTLIPDGSAGEELDSDLEKDDGAAEESLEESSKLSKEEVKEAAIRLEKKAKRSGVIYLSTIPPGMNVAKLREILSGYGKIGRIYLEPDKKGPQKKRRNPDSAKYGQRYLEGWVEFASKDLAKRLAAALNNRQVGGKRRSPYFDSLWNVKYLHRFKWNHLTERLAHEKMIRKHRLREEMAQAKRQTNFYIQNADRNKMLEKLRAKKVKEGKDFAPLKTFEMRQRLTDEEIRTQKQTDSTKRNIKRLKPGKNSGGALSKAILAKLFPSK